MLAVSRAPPCVTDGMDEAGGLPDGGPVVFEVTAGVALVALPVVGVKVELEAVVGLLGEETVAEPVEAEAARLLLVEEVPEVEGAELPVRVAKVLVDSWTISFPCTTRLSLLFLSSRVSVSAKDRTTE